MAEVTKLQPMSKPKKPERLNNNIKIQIKNEKGPFSPFP